MPTLLEKINDDLKTAMKARKAEEVSTLRMALSETKNKRIEKRVEALSDTDVIEVLSGMKKKRLEAAATYAQYGRQELAEKEQAEVVVIERYLPAQLSESDLEKIVAEAISQSGAAGPKDMGKVMGLIMGKVKGRVDGGQVNALVKKKLALV